MLLYIPNIDRSTPAIKAQLPVDLPILREPFTADGLGAAVETLLLKKRQGRSAFVTLRMGHYQDTDKSTEVAFTVPIHSSEG